MIYRPVVAVLATLLTIFPTSAISQYGIHVLRPLGNSDVALNNLKRKYAQGGPGAGSAAWNVGQIYENQKGDYAQAVQWYAKAYQANNEQAAESIGRLIVSNRIRLNDPALERVVIAQVAILGDRAAIAYMYAHPRTKPSVCKPDEACWNSPDQRWDRMIEARRNAATIQQQMQQQAAQQRQDWGELFVKAIGVIAVGGLIAAEASPGSNNTASESRSQYRSDPNIGLYSQACIEERRLQDAQDKENNTYSIMLPAVCYGN